MEDSHLDRLAYMLVHRVDVTTTSVLLGVPLSVSFREPALLNALVRNVAVQDYQP
jgi:hypothetical protein